MIHPGLPQGSQLAASKCLHCEESQVKRSWEGEGPCLMQMTSVLSSGQRLRTGCQRTSDRNQPHIQVV